MTNFRAIGAALAALAVVLGAFGAHALRARFAAHPEAMKWWETAAHYHLIHAVAIVAVAFSSGGDWQRRGLWALTAGVIVFSGSLYAMALLGTRWLGAVTPIGGTCLIAGWVMILIGVVRS